MLQDQFKVIRFNEKHNNNIQYIYRYNDNMSQTRLKCLTESLVKQQQYSFEIKLIAEELFFPLSLFSQDIKYFIDHAY